VMDRHTASPSAARLAMEARGARAATTRTWLEFASALTYLERVGCGRKTLQRLCSGIALASCGAAARRKLRSAAEWRTHPPSRRLAAPAAQRPRGARKAADIDRWPYDSLHDGPGGR
jgi:hypothetical protein